MKRTLLFLLTLLIGLISLPQDATAGRMYDPEISRFMSIDPILNKKMPNELQKLAGGQVYSNSPYNYTFNNPVNLIDPDGHFPITPWDVADFAFAAISVNDALQNPTALNIAVAAWDVIAAATPYVATVGVIKQAGKLLGKAENVENSFNVGSKIEKQMGKRGWDNSSIESTISESVHQSAATNKATGSDATAFFNKDGSHVVRDNKTGDIIQVSNRNDPDWKPDPSIVDPYIKE